MNVDDDAESPHVRWFKLRLLNAGKDRMRIERRFTEPGKSPYDAIPFRESASEIRNPDGSVVFHLESFMVPAHWSQVAADILAQKYFRKAGVNAPGAVDEAGRPLSPGETSAQQIGRASCRERVYDDV